MEALHCHCSRKPVDRLQSVIRFLAGWCLVSILAAVCYSVVRTVHVTAPKWQDFRLRVRLRVRKRDIALNSL